MQPFGIEIRRVQSLLRQIQLGKYRWLQDYGIKTIIDIGANDGGFARKINKIIPDAFIYSFEPIEKCFIELKKNTITINNIQHFNFALGEKEKVTVFHENEFSPSSSFLVTKDQHLKSFPYATKTDPRLLTIKPLDSFIEQFNLKAKLLLKLDVQGYELSVLKGSTQILEKTDMILTEVSFVELYENQPLFDEIYEYLKPLGFKYYGNFEQLNDPNTNFILQADAIFLRGQNG